MVTNVIRTLLASCFSLALFLSATVHAAEPIKIGTTQSLTGHYSDQGTEQLRQEISDFQGQLHHMDEEEAYYG